MEDNENYVNQINEILEFLKDSNVNYKKLIIIDPEAGTRALVGLH
jgi:hypothetical protein